MKISIQQYGMTISAETDYDDMTLGGVIDMFEQILIGVGYDAEQVRDAFVSAPASKDEKPRERGGTHG